MGRRKDERRQRRLDSNSTPAVYGSAMPKPFSQLISRGPQTELERLARRAQVPAEARELLYLLDTEANQAAAYMAEQGQAGIEAYEVDRIRLEYGPASVAAYLGLPPTTADTAVVADGKTGAQLLIDDLTVLIEAVRKLTARVGETGARAALVNHRFLADKYGDPDSPLKL